MSGADQLHSAPAQGVRTAAGTSAESPTPDANDLADAIRAAGLRVTRPRTAVFTAVADHPHAVTETILDAVHAEAPDISRQAVYDVLHALTDAGLLRRIQPAGHVARYETRIADNHHHLVCRSCGKVQDVDCAIGAAPCLTPATTGGFTVDEAEVVYWGTCPECANQPQDTQPQDTQPTN